VVDTVMMEMWASGLITMSLTAPITVGGSLATKWGQFEAATMVPLAVPRVRMLTGPRPRLTQCRQFPRIHDLVVREGVKNILQ
jgi:hypothetical protein